MSARYFTIYVLFHYFTISLHIQYCRGRCWGLAARDAKKYASRADTLRSASNYVPGSIVYSHVLPRTIMYYHVLPRTTTYSHVLPHTTTYYHVLSSTTKYYTLWVSGVMVHLEHDPYRPPNKSGVEESRRDEELELHHSVATFTSCPRSAPHFKPETPLSQRSPPLLSEPRLTRSLAVW